MATSPSTSSSSSTSASSSSALLAPDAARLTTLSDCGLRISVYPPFSYDASGGGARVGTVGAADGQGGGGSDEVGGGGGGAGKSPLSFDPSAVSIPALDSRTTRFLGLPLPPGLRIEIEPLKLSGWVRRPTGEVSLDFQANFRFSAFGLYRPPPLFVSTTLTTGEARSEDAGKGDGGGGSGGGRRLSGRGEALRADGRVALSGVAVVEPVGDFFLDAFLMLPTECLAVLWAELELGGGSGPALL